MLPRILFRALQGGATVSNSNELLEKVERLKLILVQRATGGTDQTDVFVKLRRELLNDPSIKTKLPGFLKFCTNLGEFWGHIKEKFSTYQARRDFLRDEFLPVLTFLESGTGTPSDSTITAALDKVDSEHVREAWSMSASTTPRRCKSARCADDRGRRANRAE